MKKIINFTVLIVLIITLFTVNSFALNTEFTVNDYKTLLDESTLTKQSIEEMAIKEEVMFLINKGFTKDEIFLLGSRDVSVVASLIKNGNFTDKELENLKKGWISSRPETTKENIKKRVIRPVVEGKVTFEDGTTTIVPNTVNPNQLKNFEKIMNFDNDSKLNQINVRSGNSSGLHLITYSNYNHSKGKFYQTTGYVTLPDVTQVVSSTDNRTRPYVMFGAYQDVSPWDGFDAGLTYYKEKGNKGTWKLFFNGLNNGWAENEDSKGIATNAAKKVYLQMYFQNNGYTTIIVRDVSSWTIIDQIDYYMGNSFNTNPNQIMITRETALAQDNRSNNGSKMIGTKWEQVYLYSNSITTAATSQYLLTKTGTNRWSYNTSYPKYIYGDEQTDKSYISLTAPTYYGETVNIDI